MKQQFITEPSAPTAQICINKSRLKIHNKDKEPTYYLKKGQEFQMEFYNPTKDTIMAKIYLNGKAISQGGLVLKPAERVFLNRYLDVPKKFLFDTYEVGNTEEVKRAIEDNGDFKVEFFRESVPYTPPPYYVYNTTVNTGQPWNPLRGTVTNTSNYYNQTFTTTGSNQITLDSLDMSRAQNMSGKISTSSLGLYSSDANFSDEYKSPKLRSLEPQLRSRKMSKSIETGRVEQGGASDQKIKTVSMNFDSWAFHTVEYKLLPISQKVNTSADINVAQYCVNCGSKTGKTDKFCAKCGTRI